jgi:S-ribosylhomocysteine lyase
LHTIEHLGATFLRSHPEWKSKVVYFGPMGCRTGFYLLLAGDLTSTDILPLMKETFDWVSAFEGDVPGALPRDCGNYKEHSLSGAKAEAKAYAEVLANATEENLNYPE